MKYRKCEICGFKSERKDGTKRCFMARYPLDEVRARPLQEMGAPPVVPAAALQPRHFPQWSRTAILTLSSAHDDGLLEVKKSPPELSPGPGFIIGNDATARVSHLEHSVRFLQEQHRLMLSGLHTEIEALRERNRDLQFQLIFKQESTPPKPSTPASEENSENSEEAKLKRDVARLERDASSARSEARAAEGRALQLQRLVDAQADGIHEGLSHTATITTLTLVSSDDNILSDDIARKIRELELQPKCQRCVEGPPGAGGGSGEGSDGDEGSAELRARLAEAERLVRRLRAEAERRRRELQCMKNSLHASLRATGLDGYGYQNNYHFPPVHTPEFWREPLREEYALGARARTNRRPLTLPELGQTPSRSTVYANNHTRPRANGYENKNKRQQSLNGEVTNGKSPEEPQECRLCPNLHLPNINDTASSVATYPELQIVVTKMIPHGNVNGQSVEGARRPRRQHRKHAPEHT